MRIAEERVSRQLCRLTNRPMPVNIYRVTPEGQKNEPVAWLCDDEWKLTPQSEALSAWLSTDAAKLEPGKYVANIGFSWRRDACSGGPAFTPETLRQMADLGMSLFISEYAGFADEYTNEDGVDAVAPKTSRFR
jgi:hypothetical protein